MNDLNSIPYMMYRSGTSKGVYFLKNDLPSDKDERDKIILRIMGSPDEKQIDGIGAATTVTTKVAIISVSKEEGIDLDYKFLQPSLDEAIIDDKPTCGNVLVAVGAFGIEKGLVDVSDGETIVNIRDVNTGATITQVVQTPNRRVQYKGDFHIAGVPNPAAPVKLLFKNIAGSKTDSYMPTGNPVDIFAGVETTCLDVSMPVVFVRMEDMGITGNESLKELDSNRELFEKIEEIREEASQKMGLGSAKGSVIPKFAAITSPREDGDMLVRYFTPKTTHPALAVSSGFCMATGVFIEGTLINQIHSRKFTIGEHTIKIETPSGTMEVGVNFPSEDINLVEGKSTRTARLLVKGETYYT